jgi:aminopeptidase C
MPTKKRPAAASPSFVSKSSPKEKRPVFVGPVLDSEVQKALVDAAVANAVRLGKVEIITVVVPPLLFNGVFSLAPYQTPFGNQGDRGTCWAFAGVAALEAAYRRKFGVIIDASEEYTFHMGKAFALNRVAPRRLCQSW